MSDEPTPPDERKPTTEEIETFRILEEQRRELIEEMRKDVATFMQIIKGEPPPPPKPSR